MKHSKLLSASILIALALLLSAAKNGAENPSPRTTPQSHGEATPEQKPTADNAKSPDQQRPTPNALAAPAPQRLTGISGAAEGGRKATEEERHDQREEALEHQLVCLTAILAGIEVVTLVLFFFSMRASIKAANASGSSARAADASLHVYRPFLVTLSARVQVADLDSFQTSITYTSQDPAKFWITIRNDGIGPADILGVQMRMEVFPYFSGNNEPDPQYISDEDCPVLPSILRAGSERRLINDSTPQWIEAPITAEQHQEILDRKKGIGLHGRIFYRGGPDKIYCTRFFWWCLPGGANSLFWEITLANRPDLNSHT